MPTGYTHRLEKMDYDVSRWLKESVVRAMGVCVMFRDDGDLSESEIVQRLKKEQQTESYNSKKLREAQEELKKFQGMTDADWNQAYLERLSEAQADYDRRAAEHAEKSKKHQTAVAEISQMVDLAKDGGYPSDSVVMGTLRFARDQLSEAFRFDYGSGPYKADILNQNPLAWRESEVKRNARDLEYHAAEAGKQSVREYDRAAAYQEFTKFVDECSKLTRAC